MRSSRPAPDSAAVTALLAGLLAITPLSIDMPLPALPGLARAFATDVAGSQMVVSAFLLGFAGGQLAYGPLAVAFGFQPVLVASAIVYVAVVALVLCSRSVRDLPRAPATPASAVTTTTP